MIPILEGAIALNGTNLTTPLDFRTAPPGCQFVLYVKLKTASNIQIRLSTDGTNFYAVVDSTNNYSDDPVVIDTTKSTGGRFVDITHLIQSVRGWLELADVSAQGDATSIVNLYYRKGG